MVDDHVDAAHSLAALLRLSGNDTPIAYDGLVALRLAEDFLPDAVILDIRLRTGNGLEVLQELKRGPSPPLVIMLTNHPSDYHRRWCEEHGADFFFDKTSEFEKVLDVLAQRV